MATEQSERERDEQEDRDAHAASAAAARADALDRTADENVATAIEDLPLDQAAEALADLPPERAADVAEHLDPETAASIVAELDASDAARVLEQMEAPEAASLLEAMSPDDRVDVLENVDEDKHAEILAELDEAVRLEVEQLEQFPPDTAGGIMTTQVTALYEYLSVGDAIEVLRTIHEELEQMFYTYVIDRGGHLVGVLSMRDLILSRPAAKLRDIMIRGVKSVPARMDQEEVARIFKEKKYLAMPVVDMENRLIGIITADDVADVIHEEANEDVLKMFGAGAEEKLSSPWHFSFRSRVWWLVINLATAFLAGWVVSHFEGTISKIAVLAVYMPIVAGMGGNASAQAMAVAVRGLATGRIDRKLLVHVLRRELIVGVLTGVVIALITGAIALYWTDPADDNVSAINLALVVATALIVNHTAACTTGAAIPFIMNRFGFDPAQSSTIFATTVTDVVGFFTFLMLAKTFLM
jgi:magnesium transporter